MITTPTTSAASTPTPAVPKCLSAATATQARTSPGCASPATAAVAGTLPAAGIAIASSLRLRIAAPMAATVTSLIGVLSVRMGVLGVLLLKWVDFGRFVMLYDLCLNGILPKGNQWMLG